MEELLSHLLAMLHHLQHLYVDKYVNTASL